MESFGAHVSCSAVTHDQRTHVQPLELFHLLYLFNFFFFFGRGILRLGFLPVFCLL